MKTLLVAVLLAVSTVASADGWNNQATSQMPTPVTDVPTTTYVPATTGPAGGWLAPTQVTTTYPTPDGGYTSYTYTYGK